MIMLCFFNLIYLPSDVSHRNFIWHLEWLNTDLIPSTGDIILFIQNATYNLLKSPTYLKWHDIALSFSLSLTLALAYCKTARQLYGYGLS